MQNAFSMGKVYAAIVGVGMFGVAQAAEQSLDLGLSNHVVTANYGYEFRPDVQLQAGFLHSNSDHHRSNLATVGIGVSGQVTPIVKPRIGAKVFVLDGKRVDGEGLAADAGVTINVAPQFFVDVSAAYSPDIVTGGDLDHYYDFGVKVGYEIIPKALVYVGYQDVQGSRNSDDYEIYQGAVVGFKMSF